MTLMPHIAAGALVQMNTAVKEKYWEKHTAFGDSLAYTDELPDGFHCLDIHKQARRLLKEAQTLDTLIEKIFLAEVSLCEKALKVQPKLPRNYSAETPADAKVVAI